MPWTYQQESGIIFAPDCEPANDYDTGYSGFGEGKNNPALQNVPDVGPIPQGRYLIRGAFDSPMHGPVAMPLVPDASNEMFGRSEFLIHGDSLTAPGSASKGCIILPRNVREVINSSDDKILMVVA